MYSAVAIRAISFVAIVSATVSSTSESGLARSDSLAPPASRSAESGASLVYRWPIATIYNHFPQLRFELGERVQPASLKAWVDGTLVKGPISNDARRYWFASPRSLAMGHHTVRVRGVTTRGNPFDVRWTFYQAAY